MRTHLLTLTLSAIILSSCATVNRGITDYFRIDSVPQGAKATTSIETRASKLARRKNNDLKPVYHSCEPTPCAIPLYRRSEFVITLEQEGYETAEMYITNSSASGSFTGNMAATTAVTTGTMAGGAAIGASMATALSTAASAFTGATLGGGVTIATFGLVPAETAVASGISIFTSAAPSYSSTAAAGSAIPPALILTGGMLATDAVTGANINLFPNPVVLKMAPEGSAIKIDPNVPEFKKVLAAEEEVFLSCQLTKNLVPSRKQKASNKCIKAREQFHKTRSLYKDGLKAAKEKAQAE